MGATRGVSKSAGQSKVMGRATREGESPVDDGELASLMGEPKYHGARAIPWESGGTTLQG